MVYLLTYDGYMKEEKLQEMCPSAILFMQCGLKDCALEFRKFYETAMPTLEVGYEIVPSVIWTLEESDLQDMNAVYPNEIYERAVWNLKTEKGVLDVMVFLPMRETPFAFPKEKEVEAMEEAYEEHSFDYSCVENALDRAKDREEAYGTLYPGTEFDKANQTNLEEFLQQKGERLRKTGSESSRSTKTPQESMTAFPSEETVGMTIKICEAVIR